MEHTPTPWIIGANGKIYGNEIRLDAQPVCNPNTENTDGCDKANARRIVACVNACEGIPTELLEQGAGFWEKSNSHDQERDAAFADLLRVNARLLEALKEIVSPISYMRERLRDGERFNGREAILLSHSVEYIKGIARAAISEAEKTTHQ